MADVASLFLDDGINLGRFADRSGAAFELQTYSKRLWRVPQLSQIKLPLVVLTSESTSSAAEIMVAALQARRRARVIGAGTCGCVLAIRNRHALPDGGVLDVSEFDYRTASGVRLQDVGITPDEITRYMQQPQGARRAWLIEQLLKGDEYPRHWANMWANWLLTRSGPFGGRSGFHEDMEVWLAPTALSPRASAMTFRWT